ncbi:transcription factor [Ganoderma sinense ZZ0214-1]|uniref:Transcription factor n=1 Tax=Ganoderma sinense ZZ0214-1 TaxID=1077348 RepID=A0A2G8RV62_9APHY|nr:transcription factor [Ganoderma sinense ZZ0214-1]
MENLVNKYCPDRDIAKEHEPHESDNEPALALPPVLESSHASASSSLSSLLISPSATLAATPPTPGSPDNHTHTGDDDEGDIDGEITEGMRRLSVNSKPFRYHGRSSTMVFIRSTIALKNQCTRSIPAQQGDRQHPWVQALVEDDFPVFEEGCFPPRDLLDALVDIYFCHTNCHYPLLHEPTFKKAVNAGQHLRSGGFGATVLLVCAIGSRFTRDPRVLLRDYDHPHSAGWEWFRHVEKARGWSFAPAKLHDLQVYALMALFLDGTTVPLARWATIGAGVRAALEVGVHRKKMYAPTPSVEEELWRRAFWTLVLLEWTTGYAFGRPCSIHDEDFDVALPTECDDEYWLTPDGDPLFKQPPGKPSKVSGFVYSLRLGQILAFANRTIYATNKSRAQLGHSDQQWEQRIVAELDSALNKWADSLPSHLRWDPEQENELFLTQAATLAIWYHGHQIAVHRSFMPSSSSYPDSGPTSLPSAIICTSAARASIQVAEVLCRRTGSPTHRNTGMIFMSAATLIANVLGLKRLGRTVNMEKDLTLVEQTVEMIRSSRYETHFADSLADTLCDLMSDITEPPLFPVESITAAKARHRPTDSEVKTGYPLSSLAIPHKFRAYEQPTNSLDTGRQQTASNVNSARAGPSFASLTFAQPSITLRPPPTLDSRPSDASPFAMPFRSDDAEPPVRSVNLPFRDDAMHRNPTEETLLLRPQPTFLHAGGDDDPISLLQLHDVPQPTKHDDTDTSAQAVNPGADPTPSQFDTSGELGDVFALDPLLGYPSTSFFQPPSTDSTSQVRDLEAPENSHAQSYRDVGDADVDWLLGGDPGGSDVDMDTLPDFTLTDDTLAMWSSMPPTFGWDDWDAVFTNANNPRT